MKAKRLFSVLAIILCLSFILSACGKVPDKEEDVQPEPTPQVDPEPEQQEEPVVVKFPVELEGDYHEETAGRGQLTLTVKDETTGEIFIHWGSSAFQATQWTFTVTYDPDRKALVYENGVAVDIVFESDDKSTETERYNDGHGYFLIGDESLEWHDEKESINGVSTFVVNKEGDYLPNPWFETDDIAEAVAGSGISFYPPEENMGLPDGLHFWKYRYMEGTIEAMFESVNDELIIRKSTTSEGKELSGDFNEYSEEWDYYVKGLKYHAWGDGKRANIITFHVDDVNWSVTFNAGYEGRGLDPDQINSLINGMQ